MLSHMNTESFVLNFSKLKDASVAVADYQNQLAAIWIDHLRVDNSGVYECSNNHDRCLCCSHPATEEQIRERQRRGV
jgi:hypothetical protein